MCGIAFTYDPHKTPSERATRIGASLEAMKHRGPDAANVWQDDMATAGHLRLSIIDLSFSNQPMLSPDGRHVIVFNGEIYNFKSLADDLKDLWDFKTKGDTEVLLAGLVLFGNDFICRLEGMWAFALWDIQLSRLTLSRDRSGKKPLYYSADKNSIHLASELPALRKLCTSDWVEDENSVADYFRYGYALPGFSFYKNVLEVLPGTTATWSPLNEFPDNGYWQRSYQPYRGTYAKAKRELRQLLVESVERRLVSDVEVGCFLSGGMDSSIVSAIVAKELGVKALKVFTIGFEDAAYDERSFAQLVAQHLGVEQFTKIVASWDASPMNSLLFDHLGQPFSDASIIPTSFVASLACQYVKVSLSGDGADELFCGYERYRARLIMNYYGMLPKVVRREVQRWIGRLPETYDHHSRSLMKKLHLFLGAMDRQDENVEYIAPTYFLEKEFKACFPGLVGKGHRLKPQLATDHAISNVQDMMHKDFHIYLPQDIHTKVDRASMRHSLEVRAPFMDTKVIEFAARLPLKWCQSLSSGKKIIADTFSDLLPPQIFSRRKQGFSLPIGRWMNGSLGRELEAMLTGDCGHVASGPLKSMLHEHQHDGRDHSFKLWMVYIFLLWRQNNQLTALPRRQ